MPTFPLNPEDMTRENVINQIIASVAMEELGLSHILNAEGEKLQYVLGTLTGSSGLNPSIDELLKVNDSVQQTLSTAMQNQMFLQNKMSAALNASVQTPASETPPPTVAGEPAVIQLTMSMGGPMMRAGEAFRFDNVRNMTGDLTYTYDMNTGLVRILKAGTYIVSWDVNAAPTNTSGMSCAIVTSEGDTYGVMDSYRGGVISGSCAIIVERPAVSFSLVNITDDIMLSNGIMANLLAYRIG